MPAKIKTEQKGIAADRNTGCDQPVKRKLEQCSTEAVREMVRKITVEHRKVFEELAK
ncbi:hypothetical protein AAK899_10155 [Erysipelotrichaceae bacterium 51-3]